MVKESANSVKVMGENTAKLAHAKVSDPQGLERIDKMAANLANAIALLNEATECAATKERESLPLLIAHIVEGIKVLEGAKGSRPKIVEGVKLINTSAAAIVNSAKGTAMVGVVVVFFPVFIVFFFIFFLYFIIIIIYSCYFFFF